MKDVISIIKKSEAAYLATVDKEGRPEIRALLNLCNPKKHKKLEGKTLIVEGETLTMYVLSNFFYAVNQSSRRRKDFSFNCSKSEVL